MDVTVVKYGGIGLLAFAFFLLLILIIGGGGDEPVVYEAGDREEKAVDC